MESTTDDSPDIETNQDAWQLIQSYLKDVSRRIPGETEIQSKLGLWEAADRIEELLDRIDMLKS
ncbi:MAG: hypothetical protein ISS52_03705 [Dehalococcoidia bacterium]|nr:hypothetical protein [Dehalococcoidia bacterium]